MTDRARSTRNRILSGRGRRWPPPDRGPAPPRQRNWQHKQCARQHKWCAGAVWLGRLHSTVGHGGPALDGWAVEHGRTCIRFDYSGHGESGGAFIDGTIGRWLEEAVAVFEQFCRGPQVVIGSSMGGWMALLLSRAPPRGARKRQRWPAGADRAGARLHRATDVERFSDEVRDAIRTKGGVDAAVGIGDGTPYPITRALIEEGRNHLLLGSAIEVGCPVASCRARRIPTCPGSMPSRWRTACWPKRWC